MNENLKKFLEKVSEDTELAAKVGAEKDVNALIALAKEMGFELTAADFERPVEELSDDELDDVTGGGGYIYFKETTTLNGKSYIGVKSNYSLTKRGVEELFTEGDKLNVNTMKDSSTGKFQISASQADAFRNKWQRQGYQFINYDSMRY